MSNWEVKVGQRYRAPKSEGCCCAKCGKVDSEVMSFTDTEVTLKCCTCGDEETLSKEEMFDEWEGKPFKLITKKALIKERAKALVKNK